MNQLQNFKKEVRNCDTNSMVKFVIGGGTLNLLDKREKRIDKR